MVFITYTQYCTLYNDESAVLDFSENTDELIKLLYICKGMID